MSVCVPSLFKSLPITGSVTSLIASALENGCTNSIAFCWSAVLVLLTVAVTVPIVCKRTVHRAASWRHPAEMPSAIAQWRSFC